jgi:hypothetical protein
MEPQLANQPLNATPERRVNTRLRSVFDTALELVGACFDPQQAWSGVCLEHIAYRVLREHYPELSAGEIYAFVVAAKRIYSTRQTRKPVC